MFNRGATVGDRPALKGRSALRADLSGIPANDRLPQKASQPGSNRPARLLFGPGHVIALLVS